MEPWPILEGTSDPLTEDSTAQRSERASFLIEASKPPSSANRLEVLTIKAMTDAASAILMDPTITSWIRIIDMGFDGWPRGMIFTVS